MNYASELPRLEDHLSAAIMPNMFSNILAIELDNSSHNEPKRQGRDAFVDSSFASAGLPILHVRVHDGYNPN